jgi:membrane peptidoglycan carboxypeptidase
VRRVVGRFALTPGTPLYREELRELLRDVSLTPGSDGTLNFKGPGGESLKAATSLNPALQAQAVKWVRAAGSRRAALVAVDPRDGAVRAIASLGGDEGGPGSALSGGSPAASVFKIITAAAAVERNRYTRESTVLYDGGKHTLFKSNVVKEPDRGLHRASLEASFAESINSVFGKLGVYTLGPDGLMGYAEKVGFNRVIPFDLETGISVYEPGDPEDPFRLAELSSGFNRTTTLSPLHAALITAGVMSGGLMAEPWMIHAVSGPSGEPLYRRERVPLVRVMRKATARELCALMKATVSDGTGRRGFWDARDHRILSRLELGGKSGTINDEDGYRVDWFVATAAIKDPVDGNPRPLALAALIVHGGRTRETSQELVRKALISYYGPILNKEPAKKPATVASRDGRTASKAS